MRYNLLFLFMLCSQSLLAQFTISGRVIDQKTAKPIPFSTIALLSPADSSLVDGAISIDAGNFTITNVQSGSYRLLVRSIGYQDFVRNNVMVTGDLNLGDLELTEKVNELEAVTVTGKRSTVETLLGKKVLNIGEDLSTAGATVTEALQRLPSVSTDMNGGISIRGSSNVIIYVNGKETQRDSKSLQFLSAGALQKIEVITNPSAKYDAGGVGGIINLVFKKDASGDFKMEMVTSISAPYRLSAGINTQLSSQKLTGYLNANTRRAEYEDRNEKVRINENGPLQRYENLVELRGKGPTTHITTGITYDIDTTFSLNFEYNYWRWNDEDERRQTNRFIYADRPNETLGIRNWSRELEDEMSLSFSLDKRWSEDRSLKLLFNGGGEVEDNETRYNLDGLDLTNTPLAQSIRESRETEDQKLYQLTIDYTSPLKDFGAIEIGVKFDDIRFEIAQTLDFVSDELFLPQNDFTIDFKKYAGYVIHKMKWDHFEYGLGVRLEHFNSVANQRTIEQINEQNVTRLFPSIQLVYRPVPEHQFAFNYSRRINRPGFFDLNPFVSFTDPLILEQGNPDLEPEFAHNYELSYQLTHGKLGLDVVGFHRTTTQVIQETIEALDADRLIYSYTNFGKRKNSGLELSASMEPFSALELTGNFSWYHTVYEAEPGDLAVRFNNQSTWKANLQQRFNLKGDWSIELSENYRSPRIGIQTEDQANYAVNLAIRKAFKNKRAVLTLNVTDIFDTRVFKTRVRGEDFEIIDLFKFQTRRLSLELRYKIFD